MSIHRRAAKRDGNEHLIVKTLRGVGASVHFVSGRGLPDLLIGFGGRTFLGETKMRKGKLTKDQETFITSWRGEPVYILRSPEDALEMLGFEVDRGGQS